MSSEDKTPVWRNSLQLAGVQSQLKAALHACRNGSMCDVDIKTVRNAIEVCDQAIHTEINHEP